jgi:hypothetical protein
LEVTSDLENVVNVDHVAAGGHQLKVAVNSGLLVWELHLQCLIGLKQTSSLSTGMEAIDMRRKMA